MRNSGYFVSIVASLVLIGQAQADELPIPTVAIESAVFDVQELYSASIGYVTGGVEWGGFPHTGSLYDAADYQFGFLAG